MTYPREEIKGFVFEGVSYSGYACFGVDGSCTQFVVRGYDWRYPDWHYPIPLDDRYPEQYEWLVRIRDAFLLRRLLTKSVDCFSYVDIDNARE